jgi:hypothetical protein
MAEKEGLCSVYLEELKKDYNLKYEDLCPHCTKAVYNHVREPRPAPAPVPVPAPAPAAIDTTPLLAGGAVFFPAAYSILSILSRL